MATRPLVSEICSHIWLTGYPSIRPFWTGGPGDITIEKSLPSAFCNIKPRHLCTCQSTLCHATTVPSYPQWIQEHKHGDVADSVVCEAVDDTVSCEEQRCHQMKADTFSTPREDHESVIPEKDVSLTDNIELSSASSESSTCSIVSVHVYETAQPVEAESCQAETAVSPSTNALPTAAPQRGRGRTRHIVTRMRSASRRFISFIRRIKRAKSSP